jgi:syntaxin 1B/2/3
VYQYSGKRRSKKKKTHKKPLLHLYFSDEYEEMPPLPNNGYRPPVPPSPTYNNSTRGDRHVAPSKEQYEMTPTSRNVGDITTTDQFFQEVRKKKLIKHIQTQHILKFC